MICEHDVPNVHEMLINGIVGCPLPPNSGFSVVVVVVDVVVVVCD